jgi:type IV secretory pathway VirB10-like protein
MHLSHGLNSDALLQEPIKRGANAQERNDPEHRHDQSQRQTAREHQYVNEQNVDDDRSEQCQRERDVAINQEQDRRNDLEQKYRDQIMGDKERPDELAGRPRRRRAGNEVQKAIQSEGKKDETKKETGNGNSDFHVKFVCLIDIILTSI